MKTDIILAGVGGQGILSVATVIGQAALNENLYIKQAEVHGMSQRGGDVQSNMRISDTPIASDLISQGQADIILAMEPMEALRYKEFINPEGWIVTSSAPIVNIPNYPDISLVLEELRESGHVVLVDTEGLGRELKLSKCANMLLLGAASRYLECISFRQLCESVRMVFASKGSEVADANIRALEEGRNCR